MKNIFNIKESNFENHMKSGGKIFLKIILNFFLKTMGLLLNLNEIDVYIYFPKMTK